MQRIGLGVLLCILLVFLLFQLARRPARLDDPNVLSGGAPVILPQRLDPNTASATELARIPHIGDALAARIIAYRDARVDTAPDRIVFRQPDDLDNVPGIGRKLITQLSPFLTFPDDQPDDPATQPQ
jgi:hypothetical protein